MKVFNRLTILAVASAMALSLSSGLAFADNDREDGEPNGPKLTKEDCKTIIEQGVAQAEVEPSIFRPGVATTRMHIACVDRKGHLKSFFSMPDAWTISIDIAKAKAYTCASFSSDNNANTSRTLGALSQPGGPLWQIENSNDPNTPGGVKERGLIAFPGCVPLYKEEKLVGGVGVSGDGVDQDECVAIEAGKGHEPVPSIRADNVLLGGGGVVPYTTAVCVGEVDPDEHESE